MTEAEKERAEIVAWLREHQRDYNGSDHARQMKWVADQIEAKWGKK